MLGVEEFWVHFFLSFLRVVGQCAVVLDASIMAIGPPWLIGAKKTARGMQVARRPRCFLFLLGLGLVNSGLFGAIFTSTL